MALLARVEVFAPELLIASKTCGSGSICGVEKVPKLIRLVATSHHTVFGRGCCGNLTSYQRHSWQCLLFGQSCLLSH